MALMDLTVRFFNLLISLCSVWFAYRAIKIWWSPVGPECRQEALFRLLFAMWLALMVLRI